MLTPIQAVQLRKTLGKVLVAVATNQERFVIHRAGIPTAVLLPLQEYQHLRTQVREGRPEDNLLAAGQTEGGPAEHSPEQGGEFFRNGLHDIAGTPEAYPTLIPERRDETSMKL